ncbi:MAG: hypothetical protein V2B19_18140 [Pseudomonadota bacterium]
MRKTWIIWFFILFCFLTKKVAGADTSEQQLVNQLASGTISWSKGVVETKGTALQLKNVQGSREGRSKAIKDAIDVSRRNLFNILQEIPINADTKISQVVANSGELANRLKAIVKEATVTRRQYLPGGMVEVTLQMSLHGGFAQLMLPSEIKKIETVRPIRANKASEDSLSLNESERDCVPKCYTGMVVDARGTQFAPALAPRIVDENGDEVFGAAFASREFAVQRGVVGYASDMGKALKNPRVTDHPMTIKGLTTKGRGRCEIIVSVSDANRLRANFNHLVFLKKCRVMIVLDPPGTKK